MRLIDADELLKQPLDTANYPSNYVKNAPTVNSVAINVLDKIRDEIRKQNIADFIAVQTVLEIIDKYMETHLEEGIKNAITILETESRVIDDDECDYDKGVNEGIKHSLMVIKANIEDSTTL